MNRLQKKCFIVATACHGLLVLVLLFGSALMPSPEEKSNFKPLTVYSADKVSDVLATSGGDPEVKTVPAAAPTPAPQVEQPKPTPQVQPEPPKVQPAPTPPKVQPEPPKPRVEIPKVAKVKPEKAKPIEPKVDLTPAPKLPHKIDIQKDSLKLTKRNNTEKIKELKDVQDAGEAQAKADQRRIAKQIAGIYRNISKNISTSTLVQAPPGNGTPGEVSVNYRDIIASKYYNAWSAPADLDDANTPVVTASITISRDGNVISARITKPSGNRAMDHSIQNTLEAVTFIEPFPASSKDQQRTITIQFNLQAKRQIG